MCSSCCKWALFLLNILSIFPSSLRFVVTDTNESKKKKRQNALNTYIVSRTMRPSVTKSRRRHFVSLLSLHSFFFFFFFYLSLRSFFSHSTIRARLLVLCVQTAALRLGAAAFGHILSSLFLYMTPNAHNTPSVCLFVLALPFSSLIFFQNKSPPSSLLPTAIRSLQTDCLLFFFSMGLFVRVYFFVPTSAAAAAVSTGFLFQLHYVCVRTYETENDRSEIQ